jgi:hypothetical protein
MLLLAEWATKPWPELEQARLPQRVLLYSLNRLGWLGPQHR